MFEEVEPQALLALLGGIVAAASAFAASLSFTASKSAWKRLNRLGGITHSGSDQGSGRPEFEGPSGEDQDTDVETRVTALAARVENVETRFPAQTSLDLYASVNDAILATRFEELARRMNELEANRMTSSKVAGIVLASFGIVFGGLAALPWVLDRLAG